MVWSSPVSRRRLRVNEVRRVGLDGSPRDGCPNPNCWPIPSETRRLLLREMAFVHKEYKSYIQLIHSLAERNNLCAEARQTAVKLLPPTPRRNLKVIE